MRFHVVTIFPELVESFARTSLVGKAIEDGIVEVHAVNLRDHATDRHRSTDDAPYGGGPGMVMLAEPILSALDALPSDTLRVLLDPAGIRFDQQTAKRYASTPEVALVCGRYEGVDDRVRRHVDEEVSLGDFVLAGGEVAAMAVVEATVRLIPGVLGNLQSPLVESFASGPILEYPQFTRPAELRGDAVPDVLLSGDHDRIAAYRRMEALARTRERRPDLWASLVAMGVAPEPELHVALVHHPVVDGEGEVVTTSITNLDVHDLARTARTYGAKNLFLVTPIGLQRDLVERIVAHWTRGPEGDRIPERREALSHVTAVPSLEDAIGLVEGTRGLRPYVVTTTAQRRAGAIPVGRVLATAAERPLLVVFGTGRGLAPEVHDRADAVLEPVAPSGREEAYNHLSVRAAAAIVLDRIFRAG